MSYIYEDFFGSKHYYSKTLKEIDAKIKFKEEDDESDSNTKKQILMRKKEKQLKYLKSQRHENLVNNLKKLEEETRKDNDNKFNQMNISSAIKRLISLPKLTKYKKELKDNKKKEEYNIIKFENVWKEQYMNDIKYNKKINKNKIIFGGFYNADIFDINYDKYWKHLRESKEKNMRLERVKSDNLKVLKKLKIHRQIKLKTLDHREYRPNYSVIEKHQPIVKLDSKSTRLFLRNINPRPIPSAFLYNSRNIKRRKNHKKEKGNISSNSSNVNNFLSKSQGDIILKNKFETKNMRITNSAMNLKFQKDIFFINNKKSRNKKYFMTQIDKNIDKSSLKASSLIIIE
jgi:hypothetical protein